MRIDPSQQRILVVGVGHVITARCAHMVPDAPAAWHRMRVGGIADNGLERGVIDIDASEPAKYLLTAVIVSVVIGISRHDAGAGDPVDDFQ